MLNTVILPKREMKELRILLTREIAFGSHKQQKYIVSTITEGI